MPVRSIGTGSYTYDAMCQISTSQLPTPNYQLPTSKKQNAGALERPPAPNPLSLGVGTWELWSWTLVLRQPADHHLDVVADADAVDAIGRLQLARGDQVRLRQR